MNTDVKNCARCGGDHFDVERKPLTRPMDPVEIFWTWETWMTCPTTGEPILESQSWAFLTGDDRLDCAHPFYLAAQKDIADWVAAGEPPTRAT